MCASIPRAGEKIRRLCEATGATCRCGAYGTRALRSTIRCRQT
jgi:hypothetical protein